MSDERRPDGDRRTVPVLTEVAGGGEDSGVRRAAGEPASAESGAVALIDAARLAELQTELAAQTFQLADRLLRAAFTELEAALFEQVSNRLRKELPDLIDRILRDQLDHPS